MIKYIRKIQASIKTFKINRTLSQFNKCGRGITLMPPYSIAGAENIIIEDFVRIMPHSVFLITGCKFIMKKYSAASYNFRVVATNHKPTVGVPIFFNNMLHINDVSKGDIVVGEDCWIGVNVTLLAGANLGRGSVVGANSLVNKEIPPYAVVVGSPAKIIATKFTKEQILAHEEKLYPKEERLSVEYLDELFQKHYVGLKSIGTESMTDDELSRLKAKYQEQNVNLNI